MWLELCPSVVLELCPPVVLLVLQRVVHTEEEWKQLLTPGQYYILRTAGTELPRSRCDLRDAGGGVVGVVFAWRAKGLLMEPGPLISARVWRAKEATAQEARGKATEPHGSMSASHSVCMCVHVHVAP